ncbi:HEAT repeat domain-containing protein [Cohnella cholangitidis]|uniref:HEAT repeat domain-containing protein n=1 Tax=Cohnella cholangitidis TaxID=2598458 RepID=A0A7G5C3H5_9BACL|nr:hypothetical protein [Cohnella cholangitidis]QMV43759.1 hypothetical protein FPL14_23240 [Cohnella cholangitidis]
MTVIGKLATSLHRKDEEPNVELARAIAEDGDDEAVKELAGNLTHKDKSIQSDCIKVLYEIGMLEPSMIAEYYPLFADLLRSKNNRLVWGAMTALDSIASVQADAVYSVLSPILEAADKGSVITKDHGVGILIKLYQDERYADHVFPLLIGQLKGCPTNQLPMYAENALPAIRNQDKDELAETLMSRLIEIEKDSKRRRVEKAIEKLGK